jgi:hypothetical protein
LRLAFIHIYLKKKNHSIIYRGGSCTTHLANENFSIGEEYLEKKQADAPQIHQLEINSMTRTYLSISNEHFYIDRHSSLIYKQSNYNSYFKAYFNSLFFPRLLYKSHHAEGDLLTQKCMHKKKVTDFGYPRACRFRKHQILNRSSELALPTFFKT